MRSICYDEDGNPSGKITLAGVFLTSIFLFSGLTVTAIGAQSNNKSATVIGAMLLSSSALTCALWVFHICLGICCNCNKSDNNERRALIEKSMVSSSNQKHLPLRSNAINLNQVTV